MVFQYSVFARLVTLLQYICSVGLWCRWIWNGRSVFYFSSSNFFVRLVSISWCFVHVLLVLNLQTEVREFAKAKQNLSRKFVTESLHIRKYPAFFLIYNSLIIHNSRRSIGKTLKYATQLLKRNLFFQSLIFHFLWLPITITTPLSEFTILLLYDTK